MTYKEENDNLLWDVFERYFFSAWKDPDKHLNFTSLELMVNYKCNLACKYCYVNRYGKQLYPEDEQDPKVIMENLEVILSWLIQNGYHPDFEIFTGEPFVQDICFRVIDRVVEHTSKHGGGIMIPTNFTFILSDTLVERVETLLKKAESLSVKLSLSASFDGKYCETNRPFLASVSSRKFEDRLWTWEYNDSKDPRGDEYYDKIAKFANKYPVGFHPMVYSENIHLWKENFIWFQELFKKAGRPWNSLYLLEVRNVEWTDDQIFEYMEFIYFLYKWTWEKCEQNWEKFFEFIFRERGFNILSSMLCTVGRGLGCSIQAGVPIMLGNMKIPLCHRTSYDPFISGKLRVEEGNIVGIDSIAPELYVGMLTLDAARQPYCDGCMIGHICPHGCLGSQLETTGDLFTPIPTVCKMYHGKAATIIKFFKDIGKFEDVMRMINASNARDFRMIVEIMKEIGMG